METLYKSAVPFVWRGWVLPVLPAQQAVCAAFSGYPRWPLGHITSAQKALPAPRLSSEWHLLTIQVSYVSSLGRPDLTSHMTATAPCPATLYPTAPLVSALSHSLDRTLHEDRALPVLLTAVFSTGTWTE